MISILSKLLKKRGIQNVEELSSEEREKFDSWQKILSSGEITVDKIKEFCYNEIKRIESQWKDLNNSHEKNQRLIIMHTVYKQLSILIDSPKTERESLEKYLQSLI